MKMKNIEVMDTTLRDGEQTSGMSFSASEKLTITKLLINELNIDRIEVASARVSSGEFDAVKSIMKWSKKNNLIERVEVLTFIDNGISIDWLKKCGGKVQNILAKGSVNHLKYQLRKSKNDHFNDIQKMIELADKNEISSNIYLEDWSNGMKSSPDYIYEFIKMLSGTSIKRIMLPDTLGVLNPTMTYSYIYSLCNEFPNLHFDFHGHNDYDLSVANTLEAIKAGCDGIHSTINGMGERAGNTPLASIIAANNDFLKDFNIEINEKNLYNVSKLVSTFSGFRIPPNKPVIGENVFTQTAGIHADGDSKNNLYHNELIPERFGRKRKYALGKTSGKANIKKNIENLGLNLSDDEIKKVTARVIELGDKKEKVSADDLPYIISDVLKTDNFKNKIQIKSYYLKHKKNNKPSAKIEVGYNGKIHKESGKGDGQFDAFMSALKKLYKKIDLELPLLVDYSVTIPPGSNSDALCETFITWKKSNKEEFVTRGLDSDQTVSAIKATEKMLNTI
ncbi:2-isopropylmalate synthase [Flavobacteriales bacterium]|nr:2-isopropylmalate synthase [Flavobacteriales bacterium]